MPSSYSVHRPPELLRPVLVGLVSLLGLGLPTAAAANPDAQACADKVEGQACGLMKVFKAPDGGEMQRKTVPGACRPDQCCELDYSKGSPPQSVCSACLVCKEGPADASPPAASAGPSGEPPRAQGEDPPALPPNEKSGCRVEPLAPVPGATLALLGLVLLPRRRRRHAPQSRSSK